MKEELFIMFWEFAKSTYPAGSSTHVMAILEPDFEKLMDKIVDLKTKKQNEQGS